MTLHAARVLLFLCITAIVSPLRLHAQRDIAGTNELEFELEKLPVTGSVLMIGAHPDDENTALLAYLARGRKLRTGYLSLTRGEGGQNLIGPEQGVEIGLIRTQELLAARRIDGAQQFFTRAIDFGFSKTAEETLRMWGHDQTLGDVVWVIRKFQPDVIINRFSGTPRDGHGNHQVSAILGKEAFRAAADPKMFPEQLKYVKPWQAKRLFWNVFAFNREQEKEAEAIKNRITIDTGTWNPELGYSYGEIAGMSRSMHRSQSMGSAERKGTQPNYLQLLDGEPATNDLMDGIDTSWKRVPGLEQLDSLFAEAQKAFDPRQPEKAVPALLKAWKLAWGNYDPLVAHKRDEIQKALLDCAGLYFDAVSDRFNVTPGGNANVTITALSRRPIDAAVVVARVLDHDAAEKCCAYSSKDSPLAVNVPWTEKVQINVPQNHTLTPPYWLAEPPSMTNYSIKDRSLVGLAESPAFSEAWIEIKLQGESLNVIRPVIYRYVDPIYGERSRPFIVVPTVALDIGERVLLFQEAKPKPLDVLVTSNSTAKLSGEVRLKLPAGFKAEPASQPFQFNEANEKTTVLFTITPPAGEATGQVRAEAVINGETISAGMVVIDHPHIPQQTYFPAPTAKLLRENVKISVKRVGYIMGAGDEVPAAIRQLGCEVALLDSDAIAGGDLKQYQAIVTGVRAFNTRADLRANEKRLFEYVQNGGTLVVQYNVAEGGGPGNTAVKNPAKLGPYPLSLSRDRVTVEEAAVSFPNPELPILLEPNRITERDFQGWVQERGLYFPNKWDPQYKAVFAAHDPGEKDLPGGTIYCRYGSGVYIYTSYAWFRQLPAGVPGAYRIFANLLSGGK